MEGNMTVEQADAILGPANRDVLYAQDSHCCRKFWQHDPSVPSWLDFLYKVRHPITGFHVAEASPKRITLHPRVIECLYEMGFGGLYSVGELEMDRSLVTAIVERWRPETHTFHLPVGEATITLQDVALLWGLPITGKPVIGRDRGIYKKPDVQAMCRRFLGFNPELSAITGLTVRRSSLKDHLRTNPVTEDSTDNDVVKATRCAILLLITDMLFPDTNGDSVQLIYLYNLGYFDWDNVANDPDRKWVETEVSGYSWGSAVLANLYSQLCKSSVYKHKKFCGAVQLLLTWLVSRVRTLRADVRGPRFTGPINFPDNRPVPPAPWGQYFAQYFSHQSVGRHNVRHFRDTIDRMTAQEFLWMPYDETVPENVISEPRNGRDLWLARVPLINWETVKMYHPDRVMRQFGYRQKIPTLPIDRALRESLQDLSRQGRSSVDWERFHRVHVEAWYHPVPVAVEEGDRGLGVAEDYYEWYYSITRLKITPPDGYGNRVDHDTIQGFHPPDLSCLQTVNDVVERILRRYQEPGDREALLEDIHNSMQELHGIVQASLKKATEPPRAATQIPLQSQRRPPSQAVPDVPSPPQQDHDFPQNVVQEQPDESPRNVPNEAGPSMHTGQTSGHVSEAGQNVAGESPLFPMMSEDLANFNWSDYSQTQGFTPIDVTQHEYEVRSQEDDPAGEVGQGSNVPTETPASTPLALVPFDNPQSTSEDEEEAAEEPELGRGRRQKKQKRFFTSLEREREAARAKKPKE